jgi:hypothetical protein
MHRRLNAEIFHSRLMLCQNNGDARLLLEDARQWVKLDRLDFRNNHYRILTVWVEQCGRAGRYVSESQSETRQIWTDLCHLIIGRLGPELWSLNRGEDAVKVAPLTNAVRLHFSLAAEILIRHPLTDLNVRHGTTTMTALMMAAELRNERILVALLEQMWSDRLDIDATDRFGRTAEMILRTTPCPPSVISSTHNSCCRFYTSIQDIRRAYRNRLLVWLRESKESILCQLWPTPLVSLLDDYLADIPDPPPSTPLVE